MCDTIPCSYCPPCSQTGLPGVTPVKSIKLNQRLTCEFHWLILIDQFYVFRELCMTLLYFRVLRYRWMEFVHEWALNCWLNFNSSLCIERHPSCYVHVAIWGFFCNFLFVVISTVVKVISHVLHMKSVSTCAVLEVVVQIWQHSRNLPHTHID